MLATSPLGIERSDPMASRGDSIRAVRTLAGWVTIVQLVGYTTSVGVRVHTTRLVPGSGGAVPGADPLTSEGAHAIPSAREMLTLPHASPFDGVIFLLTGLGWRCATAVEAGSAAHRRAVRALLVRFPRCG